MRVAVNYLIPFCVASFGYLAPLGTANRRAGHTHANPTTTGIRATGAEYDDVATQDPTSTLRPSRRADTGFGTTSLRTSHALRDARDGLDAMTEWAEANLGRAQRASAESQAAADLVTQSR